jgi:hypothetical protein
MPNTPIPSIQFIADSQGHVTQPWLYFFQQLANALSGQDSQLLSEGAGGGDPVSTEGQAAMRSTLMQRPSSSPDRAIQDLQVLLATRPYTAATVTPTVTIPTHFGQTTINFPAWQSEASVTVTGQTGILLTSSIHAQVYADREEVMAQDWEEPIIRNIVGTSFDIVLRPKFGGFFGNVKINWAWSNT